MISPKVSVCIPTYNHAQFIEDAIGSVLVQTFDDYELIVIDNCSTDNTQEIVVPYLSRNPRIKYVRNDRNIGLGRNLNRCLNLATGKYVKILLADDVLEPACLEKSVKALDDHPDVALLTCARLIVDQRLRPVSVVAYSEKPEIIEGGRAIRNCFFRGNLIGEPTAVLFRRELSTRGFDLEYRQVIDLEMWFHLLEQGNLLSLSTVLCKFRQHEHQGTQQNAREFAAVSDEVKLYNDYIRKKYIGATFLNRQKWKYKLAGIIWHHNKLGIEPERVRMKMKEHYPLSLFLVLRFLLQVYHVLIKVMTRLIKTPAIKE